MASTSRKRVRYTFDVYFTNEEQKESFKERLKIVRRLLTPPGCMSLDNFGLMESMFDIVEREVQEESMDSTSSEDQHLKSFMRDSGIYTGDSNTDDQQLFIVEKHAFGDLLNGLATPCPCGLVRNPWCIDSFVQKGHVIRALFRCNRCHQFKRTWSSSRVFAGHYLVNQKLVHSFTCAGILPSQYMKMSQFAGLGNVSNTYIRNVYKTGGYIEIISQEAEKSMKMAVEEVCQLPHYATDGEWVITDARHDSTANAYHTTVPCLSGSTEKVVGISTISRTEHSVAQTRELACTKVVLPQVINRGLRVIEVAHDIQSQVGKYVSTDLRLVNSYDTWHGTKNVAKQMNKIGKGKKRDRGKKWFPELTDKMRSIKIHLYWAMKNCEGSASKLRVLIDNIPNHYKGVHLSCHPSSPCHTPKYTPSKVQLVDPRAIQKLSETLQETYIYHCAEDFCRCRDTYWVESFNHMLLTYIPKRIHFSTTTYTMRMNLAVMDWNENVNRPYTSERKVLDLRRPDRRTMMKVLVNKTYNFVDVIWKSYMSHNTVTLQPINEIFDVEEEEGEGEIIDDGEVVPESDDEEYEYDSD